MCLAVFSAKKSSVHIRDSKMHALGIPVECHAGALLLHGHLQLGKIVLSVIDAS